MAGRCLILLSEVKLLPVQDECVTGKMTPNIAPLSLNKPSNFPAKFGGFCNTTCALYVVVKPINRRGRQQTEPAAL
jgi:hypothetical protein